MLLVQGDLASDFYGTPQAAIVGVSFGGEKQEMEWRLLVGNSP